MISEGMLAKIRQMQLRDGLSIREVSQRTGLSRNTVRQWLRQEGVTKPKVRQARDHQRGRRLANIFEQQLPLLRLPATPRIAERSVREGLGNVLRCLRKQECPIAPTSKRRRYGSDMGEISPAPDSVLNRVFSADVPNAK